VAHWVIDPVSLRAEIAVQLDDRGRHVGIDEILCRQLMVTQIIHPRGTGLLEDVIGDGQIQEGQQTTEFRFGLPEVHAVVRNNPVGRSNGVDQTLVVSLPQRQAKRGREAIPFPKRVGDLERVANNDDDPSSVEEALPEGERQTVPRILPSPRLAVREVLKHRFRLGSQRGEPVPGPIDRERWRVVPAGTELDEDLLVEPDK
jgi:hypothetical protein